MKYELPHDDSRLSSSPEDSPESDPRSAELLAKIEVLIKADNIALIKDLKGYPEFLRIPEIEALGQKIFKTNDHKTRDVVVDIFQIDRHFLEEYALERLKEGNISRASYLVESHKLSPEFVQSKAFQEAVIDFSTNNLYKGSDYLPNLKNEFKHFNIDEAVLSTEKNKDKCREVIKSWLRSETTGYAKSFLEIATLFKIEDFLKIPEIHELAINNFPFYFRSHRKPEFNTDEEVKLFREIFEISDEEFQNKITEHATKTAEDLYTIKFAEEWVHTVVKETKKDTVYRFEKFEKSVLSLSEFLSKYPVSKDTEEYVVNLILSHSMELLDDEVTSSRVWDGWQYSSNSGAYQFKNLLNLVLQVPLLKKYITLPEYQKVTQVFFNKKVLELFNSPYSVHSEEDMKYLRRISSVFALHKPNISDVAANYEQISFKERRLDTGNVEGFFTKIGEFAILDQEFILKMVTMAIENELKSILAPNRNSFNFYDDVEKNFKEIKLLIDKYKIEHNFVHSLIDNLARSIDLSDNDNDYVQSRRGGGERKYDGKKILKIIQETVGLSTQFSKELLVGELSEKFNSWANYQDDDEDPTWIVRDAERRLAEYKLDRSVLTEIVIDAYNAFIAQGENKQAERLVQAFGIIPETLKTSDISEIEKIKIAKATSLLYGNIDAAITFIESNPEVKVKLKKEESIQKRAKECTVEILNSGDSEKALKVLDFFVSKDITPVDILKMDQIKESFFAKLSEAYPRLSAKYLNSFDGLFNIWTEINRFGEAFQLLLEKPFLAEALENNERFGVKLLLKFASLDKLSKANIELLYENKRDILQERVGIDPNSRDFRIAMQNRLESYRRNDQILMTLQNKGINVEDWLNNEDEIYFELGREKTLKFSDTITTPIERTKQTIEQYCATVKEVLTEYKEELSLYEVPVKDQAKLNEELENLRDKKNEAEQAGDVKKAIGIEKGIKNLEAQIANPKTVFIWSKMSGDLALIDTVKKDVFKEYDSLINTESELSDNERDSERSIVEKRKELQKLKTKIEKCKKGIEEKFHLLGARLTEFNHDFYLNVLPALGEDRAQALQQEKDELVGEILDHYQADSKTIRDIFVEKKDDVLDGQPMRIAIWDRNPDVDLYLGNYTDCCIRIDSTHMGEECTIADYLTDVGMQIVNVYDEKKNIPIATAWCWVGHDDDDQTAFVIDNIEANTEYSSKYKSQLETKMGEYLTSYAKKVGAKLVQGRSNNDLEVASMDSSYFKLGGFNRASGYYLEAEDE